MSYPRRTWRTADLGGTRVKERTEDGNAVADAAREADGHPSIRSKMNEQAIARGIRSAGRFPHV
jgi:hypothetical protein